MYNHNIYVKFFKLVTLEIQMYKNKELIVRMSLSNKRELAQTSGTSEETGSGTPGRLNKIIHLPDC